MFTVSDIRRQVHLLKPTDIFTTRECLCYGSRAAVDKALCRLVEKGIIRRLARGVYARDSFPPVQFSDDQIAAAKAKSFGRSIAPLHKVMPDCRNKEAVEAQKGVYLIDGRSSKFKIDGRTITFRQVARRRMEILTNRVGKALSALWDFGKHEFRRHVYEALKTLNKIEMDKTWLHMRWLPNWLTRQFLNRPKDYLVHLFWKPYGPIEP